MDPKYYTRKEFITYTGLGLVSIPTIIASFGCTGTSGNKTIRNTADCELIPESMEGPYYIQGSLVRTDIRENKLGVPLELQLKVVDSTSCQPLPRVLVDIWHCDGVGFYSGYPDANPDGGMMGNEGQPRLPREHRNGQPPHDNRDSMRRDMPPPEGHHTESSAPEETFLRGVQVTDEQGDVRFNTIYPGWYDGRAIHIHCKLFLQQQLSVTTQLYLPQPINNEIHAEHDPYQRRFPIPIANDDDMLYRNGGQHTTLKVTRTEGKTIATLTIGIKRV